MPPRKSDLERNRQEESDNLDTYEQPFSEKAGGLVEMTIGMGYVRRDVSDIKNNIKEMRDDFSRNYVTQQAFQPVQRLVYGLVALILIAVVTALLSFILVKGGR